jgi:hypothetical protein
MKSKLSILAIGCVCLALLVAPMLAGLVFGQSPPTEAKSLIAPKPAPSAVDKAVENFQIPKEVGGGLTEASADFEDVTGESVVDLPVDPVGPSGWIGRYFEPFVAFFTLLLGYLSHWVPFFGRINQTKKRVVFVNLAVAVIVIGGGFLRYGGDFTQYAISYFLSMIGGFVGYESFFSLFKKTRNLQREPLAG